MVIKNVAERDAAALRADRTSAAPCGALLCEQQKETLTAWEKICGQGRGRGIQPRPDTGATKTAPGFPTLPYLYYRPESNLGHVTNVTVFALCSRTDAVCVILTYCAEHSSTIAKSLDRFGTVSAGKSVERAGARRYFEKIDGTMHKYP